jgi:hypothetical protein
MISNNNMTRTRRRIIRCSHNNCSNIILATCVALLGMGMVVNASSSSSSTGQHHHDQQGSTTMAAAMSMSRHQAAEQSLTVEESDVTQEEWDAEIAPSMAHRKRLIQEGGWYDSHMNATSTSMLFAEMVQEENQAFTFTNTTQRNRHRELNEQAEQYGWRKFSVVVGYSNAVTIPSTGPRAPGHVFLSDDFVFNTKQNENIGRMFQRCLLLPSDGTDPFFTYFECLWQFELRLRSSQPGNLMLQGTFFNEGGFIAPYPDKQYFAIVGGTGAFTGVYGVARFKPLNLNAIPPTFCYTFYLKLG